MLHTFYISNCLEKNIDDIKIASLYFDKVIIRNNQLIQVKPEKKVQFSSQVT